MHETRIKIKTGVLIIMILLMPVISTAGNLEPTSPPGPTMHSLEDVHSKVEILFDAFTKQPSEVCAGTVFQGIRLDGTIGEVTGAAECNGDCYADADGDLYGDPLKSQPDCVGLPEGYVWDDTDCDDEDPSINPGAVDIPNDGIDQDCSGEDYVNKFRDNGDGTVTDTVTGLVWLKTAGCFPVPWDECMTAAAELNSGECGLTDGSQQGDWRVPTPEELQSLGTDPPTTWNCCGYSPVTWTEPGLPFVNIWNNYWSSVEFDSEMAYTMHMVTGHFSREGKSVTWNACWPVRSE